MVETVDAKISFYVDSHKYFSNKFSCFLKKTVVFANLIAYLCNMNVNQETIITHIIPGLKEVNGIVTACSGGTMTFEQAYAVARFYYDFQDTNLLIAGAESMATGDAGRLREFAIFLKDETATLLDNIRILDGTDFKAIANTRSRQFYSLFQEASEELNPYWKRYCELNNRLDYLPLGSKEYAEVEKECKEAKAEHDARQMAVLDLYAEYETESRRAGDVFSLKASHLYALVARLNGIAGSIITDLDRVEKGDRR